MGDTRRQAAETAAYTVLAGSNLPIGYCDAISGAIAAAIEAAFDYRPPRLADPLTAAQVPPHWTCGCPGAGCYVRWDTYSDAGTGVPRQQGVRVTCIPHALVARTVTDEQEGHSLTYARARAMAQLDAAHGEQCR